MIVIKTMDSLPEYCYECPCHDGENGQCDADKEHRYNCEYRPYWCPLEAIMLEKLIYKIQLILVKEGQHDKRFKLGDYIKYTPCEVAEILQKYSDELQI